MVQYKWYLAYLQHNVEVHPIYKDDLSLEYKQETGQQFFRGNLSNKLTFVGQDADFIINAPFATEFIITIIYTTDNGQIWQNYYKGHFFKTDCTFNEDDRNVAVQPQVVDVYNNILNGMEKEFNLLEMPLDIQPIYAQKRPMMQMYVEGENIVTCFCGGNTFETDRINDDLSPTDCHFVSSNEEWLIRFPSTTNPALQYDFIGTFHGLETTGDTFTNSSSPYHLEYFYYQEFVDDDRMCHNGLYIKDVFNNIMWKFEQVFENIYQPIPNDITFTPIAEGLTEEIATIDKKRLFARLVCDVTQVTDQDEHTVQTYPISSNDMVANNRNYQYCIGARLSKITISTRLSDEPTQWGRASNGKYFLPPLSNQPWIPIGRSQWINYSMWVNITDAMTHFDTLTNASKQYRIKDAYRLATVINALLSKIAPEIIFDETPTHSQFFYDDTILQGVASYLRNTRPVISPKSNVLLGEYKEPAQKAPCTLKTIFDMLAKVYGCYWYIKPDKKLVIEHIKWFKNGGSYNDTPTVGYDLTSLENAPNGKKWAFATSKYQYDKIDMPSRYQFEWMDDVTELFKGEPINVLSKFVTEDKVEEVTIANFSTDIDLMLLASEKFSKDGFALFQAISIFSPYVLPFETYIIGNYTYRLQNYMVSMRYLQEKFLTYDMPSWAINVNGTATTSAGIKRQKKQTITFPIGDTDPDINRLVKTYLGTGQFDKLTINLSSRMANATLKYDTYDN